MTTFTGAKADAVGWIDTHSELITDMSDELWLYAEPSLQEYRASALLTRVLEEAGFEVERGTARLETAFVATYGEGDPVLSTFAEYDAVNGTSQMPFPSKTPILPGLAGCYDMHNGLGAGAIGATLAVKQVMEKHKIRGTLKVFGTSAEKTAMGKNVMGARGIFDGLDACVAWHPSDETSADWFLSTQIRCNNQTVHTFDGVSVYNAMPWGGHNALHAAELMDVAVNFIKDSIVPVSSYPIIASILNKEYADYAISSIPGVSRVTYVSRAMYRREHELIQKRLFDCANAAALALGVKVKNELLTGTWEPIPNLTLANLAHENIEVVGLPPFTQRDLEYGRLIQKEIGVQPTPMPFGIAELAPPGTRPPRNIMATTDITTFCFFCPTVIISTNYLGGWGWPDWSTASFAATPIAHASLLTAAKIIAATLLDLFADPEALAQAKQEFTDRTKGVTWKSCFPEDRPVPKLDPLPPEHYQRVIDAFRRGPKWEGWEPELSQRIERVAARALAR
jgi:aminobenzoyl-glutamate utilization protein B